MQACIPEEQGTSYFEAQIASRKEVENPINKLVFPFLEILSFVSLFILQMESPFRKTAKQSATEQALNFILKIRIQV
jgi:hypothetical protein